MRFIQTFLYCFVFISMGCQSDIVKEPKKDDSNKTEIPSKPPHDDTKPLPPIPTPDAPECQTKGHASGVFREKILVNGVNRSFILFVPIEYSDRNKHRLVVSWHGLGLSSDQMRNDFVSVIEKRSLGKAIYAYPDAAINGAKRGFDPSPSGLDVLFFDSILQYLNSKLCLDKNQVYSIGFSNGAFFTNALAQARPKSLRGIIPIAGGGGGNVPIEALIIHSRDDSNVSIGSGLSSVQAWSQASKCENENFRNYPLNICTPLKGCIKKVTFCFWSQTQTGQGTHDWPRFPSANDEILKFIMAP